MRVLLDLLAPSTCDGCGRASPPPWCDDCAGQATGPVDPCGRCAGPGLPGHACWVVDAPVDATVALLRWTGPVADALVRAKEVGRREVHAAAGARLGVRLRAAGHLPDVVVPVPTDRRRARRRGADHTVVLASAVAREFGVPSLRAVRGVGRLPDRGRVQAALRGSLPVERLRAVAQVDGTVVLVDDVVTTGGTAAAVAHVLRDAGAREVVVAVVARAGAHVLRA